ncbi:hypothetical protein LguiB_030509 [Lonicera macranthoides]
MTKHEEYLLSLQFVEVDNAVGPPPHHLHLPRSSAFSTLADAMRGIYQKASHLHMYTIHIYVITNLTS